jgi:hypothetical protein
MPRSGARRLDPPLLRRRDPGHAHALHPVELRAHAQQLAELARSTSAMSTRASASSATPASSAARRIR